MRTEVVPSVQLFSVHPNTVKRRVRERLHGTNRAQSLGMNLSRNWLGQYRNVPRDQQERALENDPQFRKLAPQRQQQLRQRLDRFNSLPPQQQERILNRMDTWEHLTPQQKQTARGLYQQMQKLPPGRRDMVENAIHDLRQMPPEQRQQALESPRYRNMFTPGERNMLNGITELPLAPANSESEGPR
jgi:hypothetical protein